MATGAKKFVLLDNQISERQTTKLIRSSVFLEKNLLPIECQALFIIVISKDLKQAYFGMFRLVYSSRHFDVHSSSVV